MALCEAELLAKLSRKDSVKILNLQEGNERFQKESYQQTTAVIKFANEMGLKLDEEDISIAHRLLP